MLARTPLTAACTIQERGPTGYTGSVFDRFKTEVVIEGPTREAVQAAVDDYHQDHAACEPIPCFGYIMPRDGRFLVVGSRGEDPRK